MFKLPGASAVEEADLPVGDQQAAERFRVQIRLSEHV